MLLGHGEVLLRSAYAVAATGDGTDRPPHGPGVLYVTNQRVVFEAPAGGSRIALRRVRETETQLDVSLRDVRNVTVRKGRWTHPRLVLEIPLGRPSFDVLIPEAWASAIAQAKRALPPATGPVHTIEREVVKVRCRFCGGLGNEVAGRCPYCGAPL